MTVRVRLFASYADHFGTDSIDVTVPNPVRVGAVIAHLRALPGGDQLPPMPLCALNLKHVDVDATIGPNDELALLPPLAGG